MVLKTDDIKAVEFDNIPQELKEINAWVLWKSQPVADENGEVQYYTKVPIQPTSRNAKVNDSSTWNRFDSVERAYNNNVGDGIGLMIHENHGVYVLDIDGTTDHEHYEQFKHATYCEYSPSGNGIHVYMIGSKPKEHRKKVDDLELFSKTGFVTVTGHSASDIDYVTELDPHIDNLIEKYFKEESFNRVESERINYSPQLSDDEVITLCRQAKNKDKFITLFDEGDTSNYSGDDSSADQALANIIAFYTQDVSQIENIMRQSALKRDKWNRKERYPYIQRTIDEALNELNEVYKGASDMGFKISIDGDKPTTMEELKRVLKERRNEEIQSAIEIWEAEGGNGKKPSSITPIRCAVVLNQYVNFALFNLEENTRLAMYQPEEGTYTRNRTIINRIIAYLEPKLPERSADNVVYFLKNMAEVKQETNSRYLIPVNNGVFNLETKELEAFSPDYVFTSKINTNYIESPENPLIDGWDIEQFINSIACGDSAINKLLWQVINDSLNGNYSRKKAIFLVGEGLNGKGTFQELLINLVGIENVATLKANEFNGDSNKFNMSLLEGKTVVIGDDLPTNVYVDDSSNFNSVVTGETVRVEFKRKDSYPAVFKPAVIQSTNGMPRFRNQTNGTYRRIVIVPFNADFSGEVENSKIKEEYIKDKRVLEYVLHKAINMDFEQFDIPYASMQAMEEFKQDNDPVLEFKLHDFDQWVSEYELEHVPKSYVYYMYTLYCKNNGYKPVASNSFTRQLNRHLDPKQWADGRKRFDNEEIHTLKYLKGQEVAFDITSAHKDILPKEGQVVRTYKLVNGVNDVVYDE